MAVSKRKSDKSSAKTAVSTDIKHLVATVAEGEGPALEFKRSTGELKEAMQTRLSHFRSSYARVFDKATGAIQEQLTAVQQEAERLREEQRQTIARLEPKIERLQRIGRDAHDIAEKGAPEKRADPEPVMDPDPEPLLDDQAMESSEAAS